MRRHITRVAGAGGEAHIRVSARDFAVLAADGRFVLRWQAHGLQYGIPDSVNGDLAAGRTVVANVSRTVVAAARSRFERLAIAHVEADPAVRAARLAGRGRESEGDILRRLERPGVEAPTGQDVVTIDNNGSLDTAIAHFVGLILGSHPQRPPQFV